MSELTIHNAEVRTAALEVKVLAVNGKQATQAVFKQLLDRDLIADDGTLHGAPWGMVNYHPQKCADGEHVHVVWSAGKDLRRARVDLDPHFPLVFLPEAGASYVEAKIRYLLVIGSADLPDSKQEFMRTTSQGLTVRLPITEAASRALFASRHLDDLLREFAVDPHATTYAYVPGRGLARLSVAEQLPQAEEDFLKAIDALESRSLEAAQDLLDAEVGAEVDRRAAYSETLQDVLNLPQLFIAV